MKFFDDKSKNINWWNRNYFYLGTILFVSICILIHAFHGSYIPQIPGHADWFKFNLVNIIQGCMNNLYHINWQHALLNMLCFAVCGIYIERKTGTIKFALLTTVTVIFVAAFCAGASLHTGWIGASGVQYAMYGYVITDYIFSFIRRKQNKTNIILGAVILALMYLAMCFCGGTSTFAFKWYPYDLLHNLAHASGFVSGLLLGLALQVSKLFVKEEACKEKISEKLKKIYKIVYIVCFCLVLFLISFSTTCCLIAVSRTIHFNIECNYEEYSFSYDLSIGGGTYTLYDKWSRDIVDIENKSDYVCKTYLNNEPVVLDYIFKENMQTFFPLSIPGNYNLYFEISKSHKINLPSSSFVDIKTYNTVGLSTPLRKLSDTDYYFNFYEKIIDEGGDLKFSVSAQDDVTDIKVYNNGIELNPETDGFYYVRNVMEDVNITTTFSII